MAEKKAVRGDEIADDLEPVSMYRMFARLFVEIAREVEEACGAEGLEAVRRGVRNFGLGRGRDIARRAKVRGCPNDVDNYLPSYDMDRSDEFAGEVDVSGGRIAQRITKCVFADQFMKDGMEKYGQIYCDTIDPAIVHGYNEDMECIRDKHFFKDGNCSFCFTMRD